MPKSETNTLNLCYIIISILLTALITGTAFMIQYMHAVPTRSEVRETRQEIIKQISAIDRKLQLLIDDQRKDKMVLEYRIDKIETKINN